MGKKKQNTPSKNPIKSDTSKSSAKNSTQNKDTKKYYGFREEINRLINKHYETEVSESEMEVIESKLIEYAARGNYDIYVLVSLGDGAEELKMPCVDLLEFRRKPRDVVKIEKLELYTVAFEKHSFPYYEFIIPEYGNVGPIPEVSKKQYISTDLFQIKEKDLTLLEEAIDSGDIDLKVKQGEIKAKKKKKRRQRISDKKFKQLCKEVDKHCTRASGEVPFFKKLSEMSKLTIYDESGRGYKTWKSAKKRYYEVFPSKKANH